MRRSSAPRRGGFDIEDRTQWPPSSARDASDGGTVSGRVRIERSEPEKNPADKDRRGPRSCVALPPAPDDFHAHDVIGTLWRAIIGVRALRQRQAHRDRSARTSHDVRARGAGSCTVLRSSAQCTQLPHIRNSRRQLQPVQSSSRKLKKMKPRGNSSASPVIHSKHWTRSKRFFFL